ncbi:fimbria/pilus outer membrane usher protein [Vagococcus sp. WN89Y]|uniref:fimbria/pilus outer membrane usher protein n=1 Tax=Vagococcus sp. WN89Y TaxID=3457258 RepID=UPI003FCDBAD8
MKINELTPLILDVRVNNAKSDDFGHFQQDPQGNLLAWGKELRRLRIKIDPTIADNEFVNLHSVPSLRYEYHVDSQSIDINIPPSQLLPFQLEMGQDRFNKKQNMDAGGINAGIVNYRLYNQNSSWGSFFSANMEGIYSSDYGNFVSSGLYNNGNNRFIDDDFVRLDSYWQYVDARNIRSWLVGDFASNTVEWGSSVRMAGFQVASAYEQRSDIITTALPSYSGSAALPSSLDLYINQQRIYSGEIPSGPFDIRMLPSVAGNDVTLITRDASGRQITTTESWYYTPKVLRPGIKEYSLDIGFPRFGYGTDSSNYDEHLFAMGSLRYGWLPTTTLTGHTEYAADGLVNIGAGIAKTVSGMSAVNLDAAHSEYKAASGNLLLAGIEGRLSKQITFNASTQRAYGEYYDAARVANRLALQKYTRSRREQSGSDSYINYSAIADRIDRYGVSWAPIPRLSLSAWYNEIAWPDNTWRTLSLNANANITNNTTLYTNFYKDLNDNNAWSLWVGLRIYFLDKFNSTTSLVKNNDRTGYSQEFSSTSSQQLNTFGWGVNATHYDKGPGLISVRGDYRARAAWLNAQLAQYGSQRQSTFTATGSLVAADGHLFAANEIGDAFVVVKNAGPNSTILKGGVELGKSDAGGNFLVPNILPWVDNAIFIDTTDMQEGWEPSSTEQVTTAGWRRGSVVDFRTENINSARAKLFYGARHQVISPGYAVTLNGQESSVVGYDGLVYLRGVKEGANQLSVDLLDKGSCRAQFRWQKGAARTSPGEIICQ